MYPETRRSTPYLSIAYKLVWVVEIPVSRKETTDIRFSRQLGASTLETISPFENLTPHIVNKRRFWKVEMKCLFIFPDKMG